MFMQPQFTPKIWWVRFEDEYDTEYMCPASDFEDSFGQKTEEFQGYGARLSAPGYLDCTDWIVADTEAEAQRQLADAEELCVECLGELDGDFRCVACQRENADI